MPSTAPPSESCITPKPTSMLNRLNFMRLWAYSTTSLPQIASPFLPKLASFTRYLVRSRTPLRPDVTVFECPASNRGSVYRTAAPVCRHSSSKPPGGCVSLPADSQKRKIMRIGITCYPTYGGSGVVATQRGQELAAPGHHV